MKLELKRENDISIEGPFLKMFFKITDNSFLVNIYDNQNDFPFSFLECLTYAAIFFLIYFFRHLEPKCWE